MRKDKVVSEVLGDEGALSPSDLYAREFKKTAFGFDRAEVHEFLERVADQLEERIEAVRALREENQALKADLEEYREMEASLRKAFVSARKLGEDILDAAKREAHVLIKDARLKRVEAEFAAQRKADGLAQDIRHLQRERLRLRNELLSILESHRLLVDSLIPEDTAVALVNVTDVQSPGRREIAEPTEKKKTPESAGEEPAEEPVPVETLDAALEEADVFEEEPDNPTVEPEAEVEEEPEAAEEPEPVEDEETDVLDEAVMEAGSAVPEPEAEPENLAPVEGQADRVAEESEESTAPSIESDAIVENFGPPSGQAQKGRKRGGPFRSKRHKGKKRHRKPRRRR